MTILGLPHIHRFYYPCSTYWHISLAIAEATFLVSSGNILASTIVIFEFVLGLVQLIEQLSLGQDLSAACL